MKFSNQGKEANNHYHNLVYERIDRGTLLKQYKGCDVIDYYIRSLLFRIPKHINAIERLTKESYRRLTGRLESAFIVFILSNNQFTTAVSDEHRTEESHNSLAAPLNCSNSEESLRNQSHIMEVDDHINQSESNNMEVNADHVNQNEALYSQGLANLGSTCYMNSVFQLFLGTPGLRKILQEHCDTNCQINLCVTCYLNRLLQPRRRTSLETLVGFFIQQYPRYKLGEPDDAYTFLLDMIENCIPSLQDQLTGCKRIDSECCLCEYESSREEPFKTISVPYLTNLEDAIRRGEASVEEVEFTCPSPNCSSSTRLEFTNYTRFPEILVIHLLRYRSTSQGVVRIRGKFSIPDVIEPACLFPTAAEQRRDLYSCFAVVVHTELPAHYFIYIRQDNRWIQYNDNIVAEAIKNPLVDQENAYILVYSKTRREN